MMYKKALESMQNKGLARRSAEEDFSESEESDLSGDDRHEGDDSDEELQRKFAKGELEPGTYKRVGVRDEGVNDVEGMNGILAKFTRSNMNWIERVDLTVKPVDGHEDDDDSKPVHDDFKRELNFYRLAQSGVFHGISKLRRLGIPTRRPSDYFAQMLKSDGHMQKVRAALVRKNLQIEKSTKAKKLRELKKMGKKIQTAVMLSRQDAKKNMLQAVKKYRQGQKDRMDTGGDLGDILAEKKKGKDGRKPFDKKKPGSNKNRQWKNEKYGFGGQKKYAKSNNAASYGDMRSIPSDTHETKKRRFGKPGGGKSKGGKQQRPGKSRRQKSGKR